MHYPLAPVRSASYHQGPVAWGPSSNRGPDVEVIWLPRAASKVRILWTCCSVASMLPRSLRNPSLDISNFDLFVLNSMLPKSLSHVLVLCFFADVFKLLTIPAVQTIWQRPCKGPSNPKLKPTQSHKSPFCGGLRPFLAEFQSAVHTPCNSLHPTPHVSTKCQVCVETHLVGIETCGNCWELSLRAYSLLRKTGNIRWTACLLPPGQPHVLHSVSFRLDANLQRWRMFIFYLYFM